DLLLAVQSDGSIFPGSGSLTSPECWPRVARENAAMVSGGPWITVFFEKENPDFEFGVGAHPAPAGADPVPVGYTTIGGDAFCMFAGSQAKDVAGDILGYVTSLPGQTNWGEITGVGNPPVLDEAAQDSAEKGGAPARTCPNLANTMGAKAEPVLAQLRRRGPGDPRRRGVRRGQGAARRQGPLRAGLRRGDQGSAAT